MILNSLSYSRLSYLRKSVFILFQIISLWLQADKLESQCCYHHDAEYGEGKAQVAAIRALTHHLGNHGSGKYAHHVHDTVCGGSVFCRDDLAEDWHIVGIKHAVTDTEEQACTYDGYQAMAEAEEEERRNGHTQTDGTGIDTATDVLLYPLVRKHTSVEYTNQ